MRATPILAALLFAAGCVPSYDFTSTATPDGSSGVDGSQDTGTTRDAQVSGDAARDPGGGDAGRDAGGGNDAGSCVGAKGAAMVRFDAPLLGSFCIDTTEATHAQFNAYLDAPGTLDVPPECRGGNDLGVPLPDRDPANAEKPVTDVSFCGSWAYCKWAGKRLCGKIGGGTADRSGSLQNEWVYACTNGNKTLPFPYGATYDATACNTEGVESQGAALLVPVKFNASCHGVDTGFDLVFGMSGNAAEFDNFIGQQIGDSGVYEIHARGGAVSEGAKSRCDYEGSFGQYTHFWGVGFRCCADVF